MKRLLLISLLAGGSPALFDEVPPAKTGITWTHNAGRSERRHLPEAVGSGGAFFDYDNDGWMDIYLVNSGPAGFFRPETPLRNALYRNNGDGTFSDVAERARAAGGVYGMGVAAADYDNDGDTDLFVTAHGSTILYRNNGDGAFTDVAAQAGVRVEGWTTSAAWFDFNQDSWLDLFVCSFARYTQEDWDTCGRNAEGKPFYCIPRQFEPASSLLFQNNGDGTFRRADGGTDIERAKGKALGVVTTDVNNDGRLDLFVANDTVQNFLFVNRGPGTDGHRWEEIALPAEVAYSLDGQPRSGMGVDAADVDGDGFEELFVSNVDHEGFALYRNNGDETYADESHLHDIARTTRLLSGWGLKFFDYNNDGALDLILANGHPDDMIERHKRDVQYREPLLLFEGKAGKLRDVSAAAGAAFAKPMSARGLAIGDYDNDGRADVLVINNNEPPVLIKNRASQHHWLGLRLIGTRSNRDAVGARITWSAGGVRRIRHKRGGGSYLSSHDPREILGLGAATRIDWLEIRWPGPSGTVQRLTDLEVDRYLVIKEAASAK
ncbi:MAG: CRTAC1 family protein [Bryobacteraceae bacterium]